MYDFSLFFFFFEKTIKGQQGVKYSVVLAVSYYKTRFSNANLPVNKSLIPLQLVIIAWKLSTLQKCTFQHYDSYSPIIETKENYLTEYKKKIPPISTRTVSLLLVF